MSAPAFTQDDLIKLNKSIAQGALTVEYADQKITYRTLDEMLRLRKLMQSELGETPSNSGRVLTVFDKGIYND